MLILQKCYMPRASGRTTISRTGFTPRYCTPARWNGSPPTDLNQQNPPVKDTLTIPARGYAILRFRTDNPGFWLVHCHAEQHIMDGEQGHRYRSSEHSIRAVSKLYVRQF